MQDTIGRRSQILLFGMLLLPLLSGSFEHSKLFPENQLQMEFTWEYGVFSRSIIVLYEKPIGWGAEDYFRRSLEEKNT